MSEDFDNEFNKEIEPQVPPLDEESIELLDSEKNENIIEPDQGQNEESEIVIDDVPLDNPESSIVINNSNDSNIDDDGDNIDDEPLTQEEQERIQKELNKFDEKAFMQQVKVKDRYVALDNEDIDSIKDSLTDAYKDYSVDLAPRRAYHKELDSLEKEVERIREKQAKNKEYGFIYKKKCRVCNIAYEDPNIHKIFLMSRHKYSSISQYVQQKYGITVRVEQVANHIKKHFLPIYKENSYKRKEIQQLTRESIREREGGSVPDRLVELEEIMMMSVEEISAYKNPKNVDQNINALKTITAAASTIVKIQEYRLKLLGLNLTPEEAKHQMNALIRKKFEKVLMQLSPDDQDKFLSALENADKIEDAPGE